MMLIFRLLFLSSVVSAGAVHGQEKPVSLGREGDALRPAISGEYAPYDWPDAPPENCPHAQSTDITGIQFTGRYANYTGADTWYPMWAADGNNYSAWTDGYVWTDHETTPYECKYCDRAWIYRAKSLGKEEIEKEWGAGVLKPYHCHSNVDPCCTGQAKIVGDSPLALEFIPLGRMHSGQSLYPCVSLVAGGVFYIGNYQAYDNGGRFNGFRYSRDWDHWTEELQPGWKNEFWIDARAPETDFWPEDQQPRRFNVPHAVALGQANRLSPDGKIYLTAHGAITGGSSNWDKGDAIYLCRVDPEPQAITDPKRYEFFAGNDPRGKPTWTQDVRQSAPVLEWNGQLGSESMTYIPGIDKFILMTARLKEGEENLPYNVLIFWESSQITGPFRLVHYLRDWGPQTYFPNIPAKFISQDGKRMWLCVSSNYRQDGEPKPFQCRYAASFHELKLITE